MSERSLEAVEINIKVTRGGKSSLYLKWGIENMQPLNDAGLNQSMHEYELQPTVDASSFPEIPSGVASRHKRPSKKKEKQWRNVIIFSMYEI